MSNLTASLESDKIVSSTVERAYKIVQRLNEKDESVFDIPKVKVERCFDVLKMTGLQRKWWVEDAIYLMNLSPDGDKELDLIWDTTTHIDGYLGAHADDNQPIKADAAGHIALNTIINNPERGLVMVLTQLSGHWELDIFFGEPADAASSCDITFDSLDRFYGMSDSMACFLRDAYFADTDAEFYDDRTRPLPKEVGQRMLDWFTGDFNPMDTGLFWDPNDEY